MQINSISDLRKAARNGKYAWPGGYPTFFLCDDGEALCHYCFKTNRKQIVEAVAYIRNSGWRVIGLDINYEDEELRCANCGVRIECAY